MPHRFKAVLKAKGGQTQFYGVPNNPLGEWIYTIICIQSQYYIKIYNTSYTLYY